MITNLERQRQATYLVVLERNNYMILFLLQKKDTVDTLYYVYNCFVDVYKSKYHLTSITQYIQQLDSSFFQ